jgi:predicted ATP-grasp superfamily ATP-dependent carboligase
MAAMRPERLVELLRLLPTGTVLMPCSDLWAGTVSALEPGIFQSYPASVPPLSAIQVLVDKSSFRGTLARLGLAHPETHVMTSLADLDSVGDRILQSSFLKPAHSQQFFAHFGVKAFRVSGREDARRRLGECISAGFQMMVQEYIPGPPTNHYFVDGFVDQGGVIRALFGRRRLRMSPPDFGNSTYQISVPLAETGDAVQTLRTLLGELEYRGIFSAEFKKDARDGKFNLIEVNARPWWYVDFAARCGVNVCEMAIRDALDLPVPTIDSYAVGRRSVYPYYDLQAVRDERAAGKMDLLSWAASWLGPYQPVFRWSDPLPAIGEVALLIRQRVAKLGRGARS